MSEKETDRANPEQNSPNPKIEDLPVADTQQDEVKGGAVNRYLRDLLLD